MSLNGSNSDGNDKVRQKIFFAVGFLFGWLIWYASPILTGEAEAFDAPSYYFSTLLIAGLLSTVPFPKAYLHVPIPIFLGQLAYMVFILPSSPMIVIGLFVALLSSLVAVAGALVTFGIWKTM